MLIWISQVTLSACEVQASAGGGAGGAGGPSIGIVAHGNAPALLDGSSVRTQSGGIGGRGGQGGPGQAPNGAQGPALDSLAQ